MRSVLKKDPLGAMAPRITLMKPSRCYSCERFRETEVLPSNKCLSFPALKAGSVSTRQWQFPCFTVNGSCQLAYLLSAKAARRRDGIDRQDNLTALRPKPSAHAARPITPSSFWRCPTCCRRSRSPGRWESRNYFTGGEPFSQRRDPRRRGRTGAGHGARQGARSFARSSSRDWRLPRRARRTRSRCG